MLRHLDGLLTSSGSTSNPIRRVWAGERAGSTVCPSIVNDWSNFPAFYLVVSILSFGISVPASLGR